MRLLVCLQIERLYTVFLLRTEVYLWERLHALDQGTVLLHGGEDEAMENILFSVTVENLLHNSQG